MATKKRKAKKNPELVKEFWGVWDDGDGSFPCGVTSGPGGKAQALRDLEDYTESYYEVRGFKVFAVGQRPRTPENLIWIK